VSAKQQLDRKVHWTLILIVVMIVAVPLLSALRYIARVTDNDVVAASKSTDERAVYIDGQTMLFEPRELGRAMTDWLHSDKERTLDFELSDKSFVPNSPATSPTGSTRAQQVLGLTKASSTLMVHILLPAQFAGAVSRQLDEQRAAAFRDALVGGGTSAAHVEIKEEPADLPTARSPQIAVLLTK